MLLRSCYRLGYEMENKWLSVKYVAKIKKRFDMEALFEKMLVINPLEYESPDVICGRPDL